MLLFNVLNDHADLRNSPGQIFLVDDSASMKPHRNELARVLRVIGYLLKIGGVDPDKTFELIFTSSTSSVARERKSTQLQVTMNNHNFTESPCEMNGALNDIVSNVIDQSKPVSIYVLTNGHWDIEPTAGCCRVERPIRRLLKHISEGNKQENWAVIQFIRFYDTANPNNVADLRGRDRLIFLDNELKDEADPEL